MEYLNIVGYCIYLPATFYITVIVGRTLYRNGALFLLESFGGNEALARSLNRFLLMGYYLLNLGYAAVSVSTWNLISSRMQLLEELSTRLGLIIIGLGMMHYFNLYTFTHFTKQIKNLYHK